MKRAMSRLLCSPAFQGSLAGPLTRALLRHAHALIRFSPDFQLDSLIVERPHYAYCMLRAAHLAKLLGLSRIAAIEFGVAGGNGLLFMSRYARQIEAWHGIRIECYGFDTGEGMPDPEGPRDLPYWFARHQYRMDSEALRERLPDAHLIIGNVRDTVPRFISEYSPPPIGAVFYDTDYWSSTRDALTLFNKSAESPESFLPRLFLYFDDIIGRDYEMYGPFNGQLKAISDFNASSERVKIHLNQNLMPKSHLSFRYQIYYAHIFHHPRYIEYIGGKLQEELEERLRLQDGH